MKIMRKIWVSNSRPYKYNCSFTWNMWRNREYTHEHMWAITSISFLRASSFRASDLALLWTSKITAAPATYYTTFAKRK
jgi:hypothetical protein